jgi:hypothetical protein
MVPECKPEWNREAMTVFSRLPSLRRLQATPLLQTSLKTGAGKTFTMEGVKGDPELEGVIPRSFHHIFDRISNAPEDERYLVRASYLEIYQEEIRDLLSKVKKFLEIYVLSYIMAISKSG